MEKTCFRFMVRQFECEEYASLGRCINLQFKTEKFEVYHMALP